MLQCLGLGSEEFGVTVRVLQCLGLGSGSAPMFGVKVRECREGGSAPMFGVRVRECSNVWG